MATLLTAPEAPARLATSSQAIEFSEKVSEFTRLSEALHRELELVGAAQRPAGWRDTVVTGQIRFGFADAQSGDVTAEVTAATRVMLVCQRCLEPFEQDLETHNRLLLVTAGEARQRDGYEAWELEEDLLRPIDLADELLVMALPFAAMHAGPDDCSAAAGADEQPVRETVRPFADLKAQLEAAGEQDGKEDN